MEDEIRAQWDEWFLDDLSYQLDINYSPWLDQYQDLISSLESTYTLDLGCGRGFDTNCLLENELNVFSADFSWGALLAARKTALKSDLLQLDMRDGFPFCNDRFGLIIANLSLHYFSNVQTIELIEDLRRILIKGGWLIARVNSTSDQGYIEVEREKSQRIQEDFYFYHGIPRRYFRESTIRQYFSSGWKIVYLDEKVVTRYEKPKALWEFCAQKI